MHKHLVKKLELRFRPRSELRHVDDELRRDISALAVSESTLFAACDETATVERLVHTGAGVYDHQQSIALGNFFDLPAGPSGEMDIEGLAIDGKALWVVGSHSLKRDKPEPDENTHEDALDELAEIDRDPNRYFLGRLPLTRGTNGECQIVEDIGPQDRKRRPACLKMKKKGGNKLTKILHRDRHLKPSVTLPCKENGFDIEGLAVKNDRVFLGLRGPVLRGWAVIVELKLKRTKDGWLKPTKFPSTGSRYRKHFLPLTGLGIRDLEVDGNQLLVLAGPTMDHDGSGMLFRWRVPDDEGGDRVHHVDSIGQVLSLPYSNGRDQAEGIALSKTDQPGKLFVAYDSPSPERLVSDGLGLEIDLFDLANP